MKNRIKVSSSAEKETRAKVLQIALPVILGVTLTVAVSVGATNGLLKGHLTTTAHPNKNTAPGSVSIPPAHSAVNDTKTSESLVDKYGTSAKSPAVAAAIRKAEVAADAKQVADGLEALDRGYMRPGTSQMQVLMHGYVPPNMPPQQAAMLYSALPKIPKMPQMGPTTPEMANQLAGVPADPAAGLTPGFSREGIEAQNQKIFEDYTRERFGPVYIPPLHRDHAWLAEHGRKTANGFVADNQMSLIEPQYSYAPPASIREMTDSSGNVVAEYGYDPYGRQTRIGGTGPDADFGYAGGYVHQPSGLVMMGARMYSPSLGRFINRDPIGENGGINLYAYVMNNPIGDSDPSGLGRKEDCCNAKSDVDRLTKELKKRNAEQKGGSTDPGVIRRHAKAIAQKQVALSDALRRWKLYCPDPPPQEAVDLASPAPQPGTNPNFMVPYTPLTPSLPPGGVEIGPYGIPILPGGGRLIPIEL